MDTSTEQLTGMSQVQMPVNPTPASHLKMVHPQLPLGNLKTPFNGPAAEGHPQQPFKRDRLPIHHQVGQEVFDLPRVEHVAGHDQRVGRTRQTLATVTPVEPCVLDLPDDRPFLPVFDPEPLPFLPAEDRRIPEQIPHLTGRQGLTRQARIPAFATSLTLLLRARPPQGPRRYLRRQCDRLNALTGKIRQPALHVGTQVLWRLAPAKTIIEFAQEFLQLPTIPLIS